MESTKEMCLVDNLCKGIFFKKKWKQHFRNINIFSTLSELQLAIKIYIYIAYVSF